MERKIIVTIPQFGAPKVEAIGFDGQGCTDATSAIEKALNSAGVENRDYKSEWANPESAEEAAQEVQ